MCAALAGVLASAFSTPVPAEPANRVVGVLFAPQGFPRSSKREALSPQIAVWVEDSTGKWIADLFVTRSVGQLGLGNRPGIPMMKSDFRWPYGRRPMVLPIWAGRRGKQYGFVVMGGKCSMRYNPADPKDTTCPKDFAGDAADDDNTIAYHFPVSSNEPYYCSPSTPVTTKVGGVDVVTCTSAFYGSKGWYAPGYSSPYPPRADLQTFNASDNSNATQFAHDNDVTAVSAATPRNGQMVDPILWFVPPEVPDGNYNLWVEVNIEGDYNSFFPAGKAVIEKWSTWDRGTDPFGQPSIAYKIPFLLDNVKGRVATTVDYAGYSSWYDTQDGQMYPPDAKISTSNASGVDRLLTVSDDNGDWRVKVTSGPCDTTLCAIPTPPTTLDLSETTNATITVKFVVPDGPPAGIYEVRYRSDMPVTDENFANSYAAKSANLGIPGAIVSTQIIGLQPKTKYYVGVRPKNCCGQPGSLVTGAAETGVGQYTTLSGCFIATAAYGTPMADEIVHLRRFRDQRLLKNPLGQAAVASYYALSPGLATMLEDQHELKALARRALGPIVRAAQAALSAP